ncbi:MAG: glycosyltransferase family 2 protein [Spongiibacteraceae bacterium]
MNVALPRVRFSVVIPCYNYARVVERAIHSALAQRGDDYEVLVINDGSSDNSHDVLERCATTFAGQPLRIVHQANAGLSAVRNRGAQLATGDYLIYLDADDELLPDALEQLRAAPAADNPALIIGGHLSLHPSGREKLHTQPPLPVSKEDCFLDFLRKKIAISNGAVAMRRDVVLANAYDESLRHGEDIPVFALILARHNCVAIDTPLARIYKHDDSMRHNVITAQRAKLRLPAVLFDNPELPAELQRYRREFTARSALSLFRNGVRAGDSALALQAWKHAFAAAPLLALKPKTIGKLVALLLRHGGSRRALPKGF